MAGRLCRPAPRTRSRPARRVERQAEGNTVVHIRAGRVEQRIEFHLLAVLERVGGFGYHHPSAEDAWRRIFGFFSRHLHEGNPAAG